MTYLLDGEETERLKFRALNEDDFDSWVNYFNDPLSNKYWFPKYGNAFDECRRWFDNTFFRYQHNQGGMNVILEKSTGEIVGQCGLLIQNVDEVEELEVGYSLLPQFRGKGFAREAASKCICYAFKNNFKNSVISVIHEKNVESERVAVKNNMYLDKRTIYKSNPVKIYRIKNSYL
ncbi:GNAT family N-acetyltransferase [Chryseosolibacter indicus]|uniref:GNAT family N-acetyltransferase n=1 Tax=Chryseosolibacter indicus TaxID=2782351 RepID=A0ABS5VLR4_9BACT|nr:GNAT family N-acetyltransferase [Chryseosolibacter indicus]MBT1702393.1 GNAT family N-acetyltransferase [Chryseosolibacter indicus]